MLPRRLQIVGVVSIIITLALELPRFGISPPAFSFPLAVALLLPLHHVTADGPITQGNTCSGVSSDRRGAERAAGVCGGGGSS